EVLPTTAVATRSAIRVRKTSRAPQVWLRLSILRSGRSPLRKSRWRSVQSFIWTGLVMSLALSACDNGALTAPLEWEQFATQEYNVADCQLREGECDRLEALLNGLL